MERYFKDESGQWWFQNYKTSSTKITGKFGGTGLIKAFLYKCLECNGEFPRIRSHMHNPDKPFCCKAHANQYNKGTLGLTGSKAAGWKGGRRKVSGGLTNC